MEKISVTSAARNLSELLNRVAYQGASFELKRGGKSIARLVPAGPVQKVKVSDLNSLFARFPRLDEDADAFVRDIDEIRRGLPSEKVARTHAEILAILSSRGELIGAHDLIIAATALSTGHAILTTDLDEFRRVPGLEVLAFE